MKKRSGFYTVLYKIILLAGSLLMVFFYTRSKAEIKINKGMKNIIPTNTFIIQKK
ncbi:MAG TPA: hypothetical protein VK498_01665 [Ferruginibacter sp.]|nr:hypothetical protein [Ferruginibacter sp.]